MGFVVGAAIGPFILGYIFDVTGSYQLAFLVCGAVSTAGIILALLLRPINSTCSNKLIILSDIWLAQIDLNTLETNCGKKPL